MISKFGEPAGEDDADSTKSDIFAINGSSWPYTEKLHHEVGDRVRWRIINLSHGHHAMHLHGFYFTVESTGDIGVERRLVPGQQRTVVTEFIRRCPDIRDVMDARDVQGIGCFTAT